MVTLLRVFRFNAFEFPGGGSTITDNNRELGEAMTRTTIVLNIEIGRDRGFVRVK